jgi:hypothetical protein
MLYVSLAIIWIIIGGIATIGALQDGLPNKNQAAIATFLIAPLVLLFAGVSTVIFLVGVIVGIPGYLLNAALMEILKPDSGDSKR